jgi:hypothetical protein
VWGRAGKSQVERCRCRSNTAGRPCRDSSACIGECIADDELSTKGKCSELEGHEFGCHHVMQKGKSVKICRD